MKRNTNGKPFYKRWWFWVIVGLVVFYGVCYAAGWVETDDAPIDSQSAISSQEDDAVKGDSTESTGIDEDEPEPSPDDSSSDPSPSGSASSSSSESASSGEPTGATSEQGTQAQDVAENTPVENDTDEEIIVYVTDTGSKYHKSGCRHLSESKHEISLEDAKAKGYEPCGTCHPPV